MSIWKKRNKASIIIQVDYDILFGRFVTEDVDMKASRAEFLKLAKTAIERRYKAQVTAWGLDHGATYQVIVNAPEPPATVQAMEANCLEILAQIHDEMNWVVRKE